MFDPNYLKVLGTLYERLKDSTVRWVVVGSLGLALQGVPVAFHDIDIRTDKAGAYEVERLFSEFVTEQVAFSSAERIRSYIGALKINGIQVEVMGDVQMKREDGGWEDSTDFEQQKRMITVKTMQVPVMSLEHELQAYRKLGRPGKVELLKRWLRGEV